jgi:hypothetical protein
MGRLGTIVAGAGVASDGDGVLNDAIADGVVRATADDEGLAGVGLPQAATAATSRSQTGRNRTCAVSMTGRRYAAAVVAAKSGLRLHRHPLRRDPLHASLPIGRAPLEAVCIARGGGAHLQDTLGLEDQKAAHAVHLPS